MTSMSQSATKMNSMTQSITKNNINSNVQTKQQQYQRFSTILVARSHQTRPTELEVGLRNYCDKIRIHTQLSGAHMIFPPSTSSTSSGQSPQHQQLQQNGFAIRIYYPHDQAEFENQNTVDNSCTNCDDMEDMNTNDNNDNNDTNNIDPDGIIDFCNTFQYTMVFLVVPDIITATNNNGSSSSFVQQCMQLLDHYQAPNRSEGTLQQPHRPPRIIVVPNTEHVIAAIMECANTITPARCTLRTKFIDTIQKQHYIPKSIIAEEDLHNRRENDSNNENCNNDNAIVTAKEYYIHAMKEWGNQNNIPYGEMDVVTHCLPTLYQLVHAVTTTTNTSTASSVLDNLPIESNTKQKLRHFFTARDDTNINNDDVLNDQYTFDDPESMEGRLGPATILSPPVIGSDQLRINNEEVGYADQQQEYFDQKAYSGPYNNIIPQRQYNPIPTNALHGHPQHVPNFNAALSTQMYNRHDTYPSAATVYHPHHDHYSPYSEVYENEHYRYHDPNTSHMNPELQYQYQQISNPISNDQQMMMLQHYHSDGSNRNIYQSDPYDVARIVPWGQPPQSQLQQLRQRGYSQHWSSVSPLPQQLGPHQPSYSQPPSHSHAPMMVSSTMYPNQGSQYQQHNVIPTNGNTSSTRVTPTFSNNSRRQYPVGPGYQQPLQQNIPNQDTHLKHLVRRFM